ncbi:MAG: hypothetical protein RBG13Loki_0133 [Promethearchaeota archaeon CR_4]|nr:MAG: hypothetical protein RBG13Loki_0133 [Candidatus Lokiarchaeota archaeon CR_4]
MRHNDKLIPLPLKVIQFKNFGDDPTIYTDDFKWDEKYIDSRQLVVKQFDGNPTIRDNIVRDSIKLFYNFECQDFARVDWKCDVDGIPKFIDFNESPMYGTDASFLWCLEQQDMSRQDLFKAIIDNFLQQINYGMVSIGDFWVRKDVLALHWNCDYISCGGGCCSDGCYFERFEKDRIETNLSSIVEYLRERPELPFWKESPEQWEFHDPEPWISWKYSEPETCNEWFHTKTINGRCIFQTLDGRCALHVYCLDNGVPWENFKFSTCTTWPLHIEMIQDQWYITLHQEFYDEEWDVCSCIRSSSLSLEKQSQLPHIVESMKDPIISRIGVERYECLLDYLRCNTQYLQESKEKQDTQTSLPSSVEG